MSRYPDLCEQQQEQQVKERQQDIGIAVVNDQELTGKPHRAYDYRAKVQPYQNKHSSLAIRLEMPEPESDVYP